MKRTSDNSGKHRFQFYYVICCVTLFLFVAFGGIWMLSRTWWFQNYAKTSVQKAFSSNLNGKISWQSIHLETWSAFSISGLSIADTTGKPVIAIARISIQIAILPLLKKRIVLPRVFLKGISAEYNQQVHPNLQDVFTPKAKPVTKSSAEAWRFTIRDLRVDSLQAYYRDSIGRTSSIACAAITGRLTSASELQLTVSGRSLRMRIPSHVLSVDTLSFSIKSNASRFVCEDIVLKSGGHMDMEGAFVFPFSNLDGIRAHFSIVADNTFFSAISAPAWGVDHCDSLVCVVNAHGLRAHPNIALDIAVYKLRAKKISLNKISLKLNHDSLGVANCRLVLDDQALHGAFTVKTHIGNLLSKPVIDNYKVRGNFIAPSIPRLRRMILKINSPDLLKNGVARFAITASGRSVSRMPDLLHCTLGLTNLSFSNGATISSAGLRMYLVRDSFIINGNWPKVLSLNAAGSLLHDKGSGNGALQIMDLRPLSMVLLNKEIIGKMDCNFTLSKFLSSPSARVKLEGSGVSWEGLAVKNVKSDFSYTGKTGIIINAASADVNGQIENALKSNGISGMRGFLTASITARGPVLYPNADIQIGIDSLVSGIPVAHSLRTAFSLHDSIIELTTLTLTNGPVLIGGKGFFDRARKDISADLSIVSDSGKSSAGTISIKARAIKNTVANGVCVMTNVPVQAARAWAPSMSIPSGILSMQLSMNGKLSDPRVSAAVRLSNIAYVKASKLPALHADLELEKHQALALCTLSVNDSCSPLLFAGHAALLPSFQLDTASSLPAEIKVSGQNVCLQSYVQAFSKNITATGRLTADAAVTLRHGVWYPEGFLSLVLDKLAYPGLNLSADTLSLQVKPRETASSSSMQPIGILLTTGGVRYAGISLPKMFIRTTFDNAILIIDTSDIFFEKGKLKVSGRIPLAPSLSFLANRDFRMALSVDSIAATNFNPFINGVHFLSGTVNGRLNISSGHFVAGNESILKADDIVFAVEDVAPAIGPLRFALRTDGDAILINGKGSWGNGTIDQSGYITLAGKSLGPSQITLVSRNLKINYLDDTQVRIDSLVAGLSNPLGRWGIDAYALLGESKVTYEVPLNQKVVARVNLPSQNKPLQLNIRLNIPNSLSTDVKIGNVLSGSASEIKTFIGGTLLLTGNSTTPKFAGQIRIDSGTATYLNHEFIIRKGYARLTGVNEIDPFIDILATTSMSGEEPSNDRDSIVITLHISGEMKKPNIELTSNKGFSQREIITLLVFGSAGSGNINSTSLISNSLSGIISKEAGKTLGLEQVQIKGNLFAEGTSQADASVSVSKKISPNVIVTYKGGISDTVSRQGVVSWKLNPFLFLDFESNDKGNAGIHLKYRVTK